MGVFLWIALGAASGWIASVIMGANAQRGLVYDIGLGILGSVVGGAIMHFFGAPGVIGFDIYSLFVSVIGAAVLIFGGRLFSR